LVSKRLELASYTLAMVALEEAIKDGWRLDPTDPPVQLAWTFELPLVREDEAPVKVDRAEILAKARAAKAQRKAEGN
jgi:hypothetical protein